MTGTPVRGRPMRVRFRVSGWLRLKTPLHVGGIGLDPAEALPVAVDGQGRAHVPGTALAGAFRSWMRGTRTEAGALSDLWGFVAEDDSDPGTVSRVVVHDAVIVTDAREPLDVTALPVRHGVAIDRYTGAVAAGFLYARTVVPPGNLLHLELDIESTAAHRATDRARLAVLLDALGNAEISLGAAASRGLGVVRLEEHGVSVWEHDFTSAAGLIAFLTDNAKRSAADDGKAADLPDRRRFLTVTIEWKPLAPVMVRAGQDGAVVQTLPLMTSLDADTLVFTLSGSSVKGALRTHAEFIERTARGDDLPRPLADEAPVREHEARFRAQLDGYPTVKALFGAARQDNGDKGPFWGSAALAVKDTYSTTKLSAELWRELALGVAEPGQGGESALSAKTLEKLKKAGVFQADHVAIDRWTGGAADGLLYSVLEPAEVRWEPIVLRVDLDRLDLYQDSALALLLLILRDLRGRRIPLGGMVNRGFGDVEVSKITLTGGPWGGQVTLEQALRKSGEQQKAWTAYLEQPQTATEGGEP
ncbi:RAMP superfamily CRISPR-associated protein [Actinocorallia sp. API 0066]|uniref:RAMP superfamily CRISPR-associated protein n=1 Tax=Actinocorallia sp. API 0066 TaxID=2896846 RepID=UPI001E57EEC9|nr:RAMP superfamily CRISPR-associated protein [Actinocorallia sp. API 0066]MCD0449400.1 RAMP superfamily CRISPR-associated protein [Actinocorallia sp. API 0066]